MKPNLVYKDILTPNLSENRTIIYQNPVTVDCYFKYELTLTNLKHSLTPFKIYITTDVDNITNADLVYHSKLLGAGGTDGCGFESNFKQILPGEIMVIELPDKDNFGWVSCRLVVY